MSNLLYPLLKRGEYDEIIRKRALILQFKELESKMYFLKKKAILHGLGGGPIYLDD